MTIDRLRQDFIEFGRCLSLEELKVAEEFEDALRGYACWERQSVSRYLNLTGQQLAQWITDGRIQAELRSLLDKALKWSDRP